MPGPSCGQEHQGARPKPGPSAARRTDATAPLAGAQPLHHPRASTGLTPRLPRGAGRHLHQGLWTKRAAPQPTRSFCVTVEEWNAPASVLLSAFPIQVQSPTMFSFSGGEWQGPLCALPEMGLPGAPEPQAAQCARTALVDGPMHTAPPGPRLCLSRGQAFIPPEGLSPSRSRAEGSKGHGQDRRGCSEADIHPCVWIAARLTGRSA